jgi:hypothetical protein
MAVELENAAIFGLTGEPLVVTVPPPPLLQVEVLPLVFQQFDVEPPLERAIPLLFRVTVCVVPLEAARPVFVIETSGVLGDGTEKDAATDWNI